MRIPAFVAALLSVPCGALVAAAADTPNPELAKIEGYRGEAMEPFLSRDGQVLFFNTLNDPKVDTDIHFARRRDDLTFVYQGVLKGTQSKGLDGVATMSRDGRFCFISPRDYGKTLNTVYCGRFTGSEVAEVVPQSQLKTMRSGRLIFDVELSADGEQLVFAEGTFSGGSVPDETDLFLAVRGPNGFVRASDSQRIFAKVNTDAQEYAAALSADSLQLYFTRLSGWFLWREVHIYRATRASPTAAFGAPQMIPLDGFIEGPTVAPDGRAIYFHKLVDGHFSIWRLKLP